MSIASLRPIRRLLPEGRLLPQEIWWGRHRAIIVLLWVHAVAIPVFALIRGFSLTHSLVEGAIVPLSAVFAMSPRLSRRARTAAASLGLLTSSAVLVHLSGGVIEMHFHFFVMVTVVALYQDWLPFLAAIGYVFIHHGFMGAVDAKGVYNHAAAWGNPWKWAAIHALFITGISAVCLVTWRLNETMLAQRRRAEERLLEETRIVESLHEVGKVVAAELDPHRVIQTVTDRATEGIGAAYGAFFYNVVGPSGEAFMLYTLSGAPLEAFSGFGLPRNTEIFRPTFTGEAVVRLDDVTQDPRYGLQAPHFGLPKGHLPVRSYLAVPVRSRTGEVIGGLFFGHPEEGRFTQTDERFVVGIASHAAIAIDNARLYESEREARKASDAARSKLALLADASRVLTSSLEVDRILGDLGRLLVPSVADSFAVYLVEEDGSIRNVATIGSEEATIRDEGVVSTGSAHPVARVIATRQIELRSAADGPPVVNDGPPTGTAGASALLVPIVGRSTVLGCLALGSRPGSTRRLSEDVSLAEELSRRAAVAVENARLFARQRTVAETLQHSLLPESLPEIPGLAVAARYIAGGPDVEVGGDWYDVILLRGGLVAFAMGDVVGRGEGAASLMGQLRNAIRAYALERCSPRELVERVNYMLYELGHDHMATMVYGVVDLESGEVTYVNAGHPPPMVVGADRSIRFLDEPIGVPMGVTPHSRYVEGRFVVAPDTSVILYTDGLVEDRLTPLDVGFDLLRAAVQRAPDDLDGLVQHLIEQTMLGRQIGDDTAALAFRLLPLGDALQMRLPADPHVLAPVRAALRRWLAAAGASDHDIHDVIVAVAEACANAIQHAGGPPGSSFELEARLDGDVSITIRDHGRWRRRRDGVGGRGLNIIETLMDSVDVDRSGFGTVVTMRRRLQTAVDDDVPV